MGVGMDCVMIAPFGFTAVIATLMLGYRWRFAAIAVPSGTREGHFAPSRH
jgi:hypothetical protein